MSWDDMQELTKLCEPIVHYINKKCTPHDTVIISGAQIKMVNDVFSVSTESDDTAEASTGDEQMEKKYQRIECELAHEYKRLLGRYALFTNMVIMDTLADTVTPQKLSDIQEMIDRLIELTNLTEKVQTQLNGKQVHFSMLLKEAPSSDEESCLQSKQSEK